MTSGYAASRRRVQCAIGWLVFVLAACLPLHAAPAATGQTPAASSEKQHTVLVIGDSLSAAYGLSTRQGWVALTAKRIAETHPDWRVVNGSVSGETTSGGAARVTDAVVKYRPDVLVIELGANDGLRGLPTQQAGANLARMIGAAHGVGAKVLLIGMRMPPNLGADYTRAFEGNYRTLSDRYGVALLPFLLEPIAGNRDSFQDDNLHPVAEAQPTLRDHVWPALEPLLD